MKVAAMTATTHNPSEEPCWVSCLRENFMSSSYGEELETGPAARSGTAPVPHPTSGSNRTIRTEGRSHMHGDYVTYIAIALFVVIGAGLFR